MPEVYCLRAEFGKYAENFLKGDYVAIGWFHDFNLKNTKSREEIRELYTKHHPQDTSPYAIGQQVGQIARFLLEIKPNDFVITPGPDTEYVYYGILKDELYEFVKNPNDGCPYQHRRHVKWISKIQRSAFSMPLQYALRSSLTIFKPGQNSSFFEAIGRKDIASADVQTKEKNTELVLKRILELDGKEFELLVTSLLGALGFEAQHVGKSGDGGVDAEGELNLYNMAKVKLKVQAKRYKLDSKITANQVKDLRKNIPHDSQGTFVATCDFQKKALDVATEPRFPRIGIISGAQLVDLLTEKWDLIDEDLREKLNLKKGLIVE